MRVSHFILVALAIVACCICWWFGYRTGMKESPMRAEREGQLAVLYHTYRMVEATNWSKVHSAVGIQMLGLTRDYERRFGMPTGTNRFARRFPEIQKAATQFERQLVTVASIFTNLQTTPDVDASVKKEP